MKTMRAMRLSGLEEPLLVLSEEPIPEPGPGEILVRVCAAGLTPTELQWYPTTHARDGGVRSGAIPGHEFSGVVAACGPGTEGWAAGMEIFGLNDWFAEGAAAEYCMAVPAQVAAKPRRLSHAEAASVPIGALTAWQGLLERARVQPGERVLVHGGSGAVGIYAIQLAKRAGARVITTASRRNFAFLAELGADELIDYREERFEEKARELDVIFDGVGGETLRRSWGLLKEGGRMVTIAADSEGTKDERIEKAFFIVEPKGGQLGEIAALLDSGELRACVDAEVPLERAAEAYAGRVERRGRGKIVLSLERPS